jgi:hypothetical protein
MIVESINPALVWFRRLFSALQVVATLLHNPVMDLLLDFNFSKFSWTFVSICRLQSNRIRAHTRNLSGMWYIEQMSTHLLRVGDNSIEMCTHVCIAGRFFSSGFRLGILFSLAFRHDAIILTHVSRSVFVMIMVFLKRLSDEHSALRSTIYLRN